MKRRGLVFTFKEDAGWVVVLCDGVRVNYRRNLKEAKKFAKKYAKKRKPRWYD